MRSTLRPRVLVLYDADCGFCTRAVALLRKLDRQDHLELLPLQVAAETLPGVPSMDQLLEAMHVRDTDGAWSVGGAAWIRISDEVRLLRPFGIVARLPGIRSLVEPTYAWVAAHRGRISHLLGDDACAIDRTHV